MQKASTPRSRATTSREAARYLTECETVRIRVVWAMTEVGIVRSWQKDDQPKAQPRGRGFWPQNKGFGFIERENGDSIFVHKTNIQDGNALLPDTEVHFDVETSDKKPGQRAPST